MLNLLCFFNSYGTPHGANKSAGRLKNNNFKAGKRRVSYVFATSSHTGGKSQRVFHVCSFAGFVLTRLTLLILFFIRALFSKFSICVPH